MRTFKIRLIFICLVISGAAIYLYHYITEKRNERQWQLVHKEDFENISLSDLDRHWRVIDLQNYSKDSLIIRKPSKQSFWSVEDGLLHGIRSGGGSSLRFEPHLHDFVKVEWTLAKADLPRNLNAFISGSNREEGYHFHIGSWGLSTYCALTRAGEVVDLHHIEKEVNIQKPQKFRMEKAKSNLRFYINDEIIFDFDDLDPLDGPQNLQLGIEVGDNHLSFDDIAIYHIPQDQEASELQRAKARYHAGDYEASYKLYSEHLQHELTAAQKSNIQLKIINSLMAMEQHQKALEATEVWMSHQLSTTQRHHAILLKGKLLFDLKKNEEAIEALISLTKAKRSIRFHAFNELQNYLIEQPRLKKGWSGRVLKPDAMSEIKTRLENWLNAFDLYVPFNFHLNLCATYENQLGNHEEVLNNHPHAHWANIQALQLQGNYELILKKYQLNNDAYCDALLKLGRYHDILNINPDQKIFTAIALCRLNQHDDVFDRFPNNALLQSFASFDQGHFKKSLAQGSQNMDGEFDWQAQSLMGLKKFEKVLQLETANALEKSIASLYLHEPYRIQGILDDPNEKCDPHLLNTLIHSYRAINFAEHGEVEKTLHHLNKAPFEKISLLETNPKMLFTRFFLEPWLKAILTKKTPRPRLEQLSQKYRYRVQQILHHQCEFLMGNISEKEYLNQPLKDSRPWQLGCLHWLKGLKADLDGRDEEALKHYRKDLKHPWQHRDVDPLRDMFVAWRINILEPLAQN
jgi:hypothetical protein